MTDDVTTDAPRPTVFLSYATEDRDAARLLRDGAGSLMSVPQVRTMNGKDAS